MNIQKTPFRLLAVLAIICVTGAIMWSCDEDDMDKGFVIHYGGVTNIGPSMSFTSSPPTYWGGTPSGFAITGITLNDAAEASDCFSINSETGEISITDTDELPTGKYKVSVSCSSNGKFYSFPDAFEVDMLPATPEAVEVNPSQVNMRYGNKDEMSRTAQVTTVGSSVSITSFRIYGEEHSKYFNITSNGVISVDQSGDVLPAPGKYPISLTLNTIAGTAVYNDVVIFDIYSEPLGLEYTPAEGMTELEYHLNGLPPVLFGSDDDLVYSIAGVTPNTNQISIDSSTGAIVVADGHSLAVGEYAVDVKVDNKYGTKTFDGVYTVKVVTFIEPIDNFTYEPSSFIQGQAFEVAPSDGMIGDAVSYELVDLPAELSEISLSHDGKLSAPRGNKIPEGTHTVKVRASNIKNSVEATLNLTIEINEYFFTTIVYGNNIGLDDFEHANQFRFYSKDELKPAKIAPVYTDIPEGVKVEWSIRRVHQASQIQVDSEGVISVPEDRWAEKNGSMVVITATTGKGTPGETSVSVPVFFAYMYSTTTQDVFVQYNPFVFQVNPRTGGVSAPAQFTGPNAATTVMDYRRTFNYYNLNGPANHVDGQPTNTESFMYKYVWYKFYDGKPNTGQKWPLSYYENRTSLSTKPYAYVDPTRGHAVVVNPNKWMDDLGNYANGVMHGQMTVNGSNDVANISDNKYTDQIFPIFIWFDEKF